LIVDVRTQIREAMGVIDAEGWVRTAAAPPPPPHQGASSGGPPGMPPTHMPPGAEQSGTRQIPKNHKFDPKALKPMARALFAMSVSLGHALQAYRTLNRVKSSSVSPDGMLGGRGYVMKIAELRQKLYDACEALSMVSDTIHDEINAPHWKPRIAELDQGDFEAIDRLIGQSESNLDNPEEGMDEEEDEVEKKGKPSKKWPPKGTAPGGSKIKKDDEPASDLPGGGDNEAIQKIPRRPKQASAYDRRASTINVDQLGGPRVKHLDRADSDQTGPYGTYGEEDTFNDGSYPENWDNEQRLADSALPSDDSPSKGLDFGIGDGTGNGSGFNYGPAGQEGGQKVWTPTAELPDDPGGDTTGDDDLSEDVADRVTHEQILQAWANPSAVSEVPDDNGDGVARSDYYDGDKPDNQMNTVRGETELPGDPEGALADGLDMDIPNAGYRYERQDQPHTKRGL
jgi:hypothetical protein